MHVVTLGLIVASPIWYLRKAPAPPEETQVQSAESLGMEMPQPPPPKQAKDTEPNEVPQRPSAALIKAVSQAQVEDVRPLLTPDLDLDCEVFVAQTVVVTGQLLFKGRPETRELEVCDPHEATTLLSIACLRGDAQIVGALLDARASPDAGRTLPSRWQGRTLPLQWALSDAQSIDCASMLLKAGATTLNEQDVDPEQADGGGMTCLCSAAYEGNLSKMRLLLEHDADVDLPRHSGATPLYAAAQEGHTDAVRLLLAFDANIEKRREHSGATPLFIAGLNGRTSCVKLLLDAQAEPEALAKDGETPLSLCRKGLGNSNADCRRLLEAAAAGNHPPPAAFDTLAERALATGLLTEAQLDGITDLIARGVRTERDMAFKLHMLPLRVSPCATELAELVCRPHATIRRLRELLERTHPDELNAQLPRWMIGGGTLLRAACRLGAVGEREQTQDPESNGALMCTELIGLLLSAGADPDALSLGSSTDGLTPLMAALGFNDAACVALLEGGADVNKPDGGGYAPLLAASEWGQPRVVRLLLSFGARTDVVSPSEGVGYTPLIAAVVTADAVCVGLLLEAGADASKKYSTTHFAAKKNVPMNALEWARFLVAYPRGTGKREAVVRELTRFERFCESAITLNVLDQAAVDALNGELERGEATRSELIQRHGAAINAAADERRSLVQAAEASTRLAFESDRQPAPDQLLPADEWPVYKGLVELQGLVKAPHLNGERGVCVSFNVDGKRRLAVKLSKTKKTLALNPQNCRAIDSNPLPMCAHTSAEACEALQAELVAAGSPCTVVDWTPLAADTSIDQAHLHRMGQLSSACEPFCRTLYYVQRTSETEAHMLLCRELMNNGRMNEAGTAFALPWLVYGGGEQGRGNEGETLTPPASEWCAELSYITRLVVGATASTLACSVCLERLTIQESPSQLPCFHVLCTSCMKRLFTINKKGLKCPSCQREHTRWSLHRNDAAPGGVCVVEHVAGR